MAVNFLKYCINTPLKRFACLQNKFFGYFIPSSSDLYKPIFRWEVVFVF